MFDAHNHWLPREIIDQAHFYSDAWGNIERQLALMDKFQIAQASVHCASPPARNAIRP